MSSVVSAWLSLPVVSSMSSFGLDAASFLLYGLIILLGCLFTVFKFGTRTVSTREARPSPPGPWGLPVLGNLLQLGRKPHRKLTEYRKRYGDVYRIVMGSRPTVVLNGFDTIWRACVKQAEDFAGRPDFYTFRFIANGDSMGFGDYGRRWKMHRKIAQNALSTFVNKRTNPIEDTISAEADVLVEHLLAAEGKAINPHNEIYLSVGNIICAICFGKRYKRDDPDFLRLVTLNDKFMAEAAAGNPVDIMPWTRHLPPVQRKFQQFLDILHLMNKFCGEKQQEHFDTYDPGNMRDVTDILIRTVKETPGSEKEAVGLTDQHILTTVQELIGAGFDTISSTLQWSVLYLMTHPRVQEAVHAELRRVVGARRAVSLDDLQALPYTEAVLLEVMRHSCIFPFALPHSTTRDTVINGYSVPAKTLVFVNLWSVSHDPEVFPDPERFNPDRFLDSHGNVDRRKADQFLPYGAGRRRCPGEQLARMELFLFFSTIAQRCRFEVPPGQKPVIDSKYGLTLKPLDFQVCVSARE